MNDEGLIKKIGASLQEIFLSPSNKIAAWVPPLETAVFTLFILLLTSTLNPTNPSYAETAFPWPLFIPMLIALRYGTLWGLISIATCLLWFYHISELLPSGFHYYVLGNSLVICLCGQYRSHWGHRLLQAESTSDYAKIQFDQTLRAYHVTKLSHDQLEQGLISKKGSLRGSLDQVRQLLLNTTILDEKIAYAWLNITGHYASIEDAGIFIVNNDSAVQSPIASLGTAFKLKSNDPLIHEFFQRNELCYLPSTVAHLEANSDYLLVAPIKTSEGSLLALLVIKNMPFWSLNQDTIQGISALCGYFANQLLDINRGAALLNAYPNCPSAFANELYCLHGLLKTLNLPTAIAHINLANSHEARLICKQWQNQHRALDTSWIHIVAENINMLTVLPFASTENVSAYLEHFKECFAHEFRANNLLDKSHYNIHWLTQIDPLAQLKPFLQADISSGSARHDLA